MDRMSIMHKHNTPLNWQWLSNVLNQAKCLVIGWWNNCDESHYEKVDNDCFCKCHTEDRVTSLFWTYCGGNDG